MASAQAESAAKRTRAYFMANTFKIEGFKELDQQLGRLSKTAGRAALRKAGKSALEPMARIARQIAPDDPSTNGPRDLSESIDVSTRTTAQYLPEGKFLMNLYMGPSTKAFHGAWQEFGTVNHAPQPFMRPAWDRDSGNLIERLRIDLWDSISAALNRAAKRGDL